LVACVSYKNKFR